MSLRDLSPASSPDLLSMGAEEETVSRRWLAILAGANAVLAVMLALVVVIAAQHLPGVLAKHPGLAWTCVAILGLGSLLCAVFMARIPGKPEDENLRSAREGRVQAGRDLIIQGDRNAVAGGDSVIVMDLRKATPARNEDEDKV
jgi:hypothetical protein